MKSSNLVIPKDENGPETEAEMHAEETRRAVEGSKSTLIAPSTLHQRSRARIEGSANRLLPARLQVGQEGCEQTNQRQVAAAVKYGDDSNVVGQGTEHG